MPLLAVPWFARRPLVRRSREIAAVLASHGLASLAGWTGLSRFRGVLRRREPVVERTQAEHLRLALGELGVSFVKLGQMLSTRADLIPQEFVVELAKLQDAAPPVPYADIRAVLTAELGVAPEEAFARFDPVPIASASIGQVHAATLADGTEVVVKVQRPGIAEAVERDLELLFAGARWAQEHMAFARDLDLPALADEFAFTLRNELDYRRERQNVERFGRFFADDPRVHVPRAYAARSTGRVLTLERMTGIKISDLAALERADISGRAVAENAVHLFIRQILELGLFHADPHPGNFFVQPDGSIALLDYGMVGRVTEGLQLQLLRAGLAAMHFDSEALAEELYAMGVAGRGGRHAEFVRDLDHVLHRYAGSTVADISATQVIREFTDLAYRHRLQLPSELALLLRVIVMSDGMGLQLDPGFQFLDSANPLIRRRWRERHGPGQTLRRFGRSTWRNFEIGMEMPERLARLAARAERGQIDLNINHEGLGPTVRAFQAMINRLAIAVLLAATIVALGLMLAIGRPAGWPRLAGTMLSLAFPITLVLGAWIVFGMWRSGRR